jgi:hypothetical protein
MDEMTEETEAPEEEALTGETVEAEEEITETETEE